MLSPTSTVGSFRAVQLRRCPDSRILSNAWRATYIRKWLSNLMKGEIKFMSKRKVQVLRYVRHKTARWEGVVYKQDGQFIRVANRFRDWQLTDERNAQLEDIEVFDLPLFIAYLKANDEFIIDAVNYHLLYTLIENLQNEMGTEQANRIIEEKCAAIAVEKGEN